MTPAEADVLEAGAWAELEPVPGPREPRYGRPCGCWDDAEVAIRCRAHERVAPLERGAVLRRLLDVRVPAYVPPARVSERGVLRSRRPVPARSRSRR